MTNARRIVLSPLAEEDLLHIYEYTLETWGKTQAAKYLRAIDADMRALANGKLQGCSRDDVAAPCKIYRSGRHLIIHRMLENTMEVVMVLHEAMNVEQRLEWALVHWRK